MWYRCDGSTATTQGLMYMHAVTTHAARWFRRLYQLLLSCITRAYPEPLPYCFVAMAKPFPQPAGTTNPRLKDHLIILQTQPACCQSVHITTREAAQQYAGCMLVFSILNWPITIKHAHDDLLRCTCAGRKHNHLTGCVQHCSKYYHAQKGSQL